MPKQNKSDALYAITHQRASKGTPYWCVNFSRKGVSSYKRFYEPKYGGTDQALAAAVAWRDQQLAQLAAMTMVEFCAKKRSSNSSGVPGVHFLKSKAQPHGFWQAKLKLGGGKYLSRNFSVLYYGDKEAFDLAVSARKAMLANAEDRPFVRHPTAREFASKFFGLAPADKSLSNADREQRGNRRCTNCDGKNSTD